jgi:hypothetical protein
MDAVREQFMISHDEGYEDHDGSDEADHVELESYQKYLVEQAQCAYIRRRADNLEKNMRLRFQEYDQNPINVFSVSASMYNEWSKRKTMSGRPALSPTMAGIPRLRQFLLGLPAEGNHRRYSNHMSKKLPFFLELCRLSDPTMKHRGYAEIRDEYIQHVQNMKKTHEKIFLTFLSCKIPQLWNKPGSKESRIQSVACVVTEWSKGIRWQTYNKILREHGIPVNCKAAKLRGRTVNWNNDLGQELLPDIDQWRTGLNRAVTELATTMDHITKTAVDKVPQILDKAAVEKDLKRDIHMLWRSQKVNILCRSESFQALLKECVMRVYRYGTTETDFGCMIAKINSSMYRELSSLPRQPGRFHIQQGPVYGELATTGGDSPKFLDKVAAALEQKAREEFTAGFDIFLDKLIKDMNLFSEQLGELLPTSYEMTQHDLAIRKKLRDVIPVLEEKVRELQILFQANEEEDGNEDVDVPAAKRRKV